MSDEFYSDQLAVWRAKLAAMEIERAATASYLKALEIDPVHSDTLERLPQLPDLLDGYLRLIETKAAEMLRACEDLEAESGESDVRTE